MNESVAEHVDDADRVLIEQVRGALQAAAKPEHAGPAQRYMKSTMPFYGVRMPELRRIVGAAVRERPFADAETWRATVLTLWRGATYREERYAALAMLRGTSARGWLVPAAMPMLEELVVTGAWWDFVDETAKHVGTVLVAAPDRIAPLLREWAVDDDLWKRRTAIICQLGRKQQTDLELLRDCILPSMESSEFFLRKAIGWALRDLSRHDPEWVVGFATQHRDALSRLSKREALRVLVSEGRAEQLD